MLTMFARNWWVLALRGVLAITFGFVALRWPGPTLLTLVLLFGTYALVDGLFGLIQGFHSRERDEHWWAVGLEGIVGVTIGLLTFLWPGTTAFVLLLFIAGWAVVSGILEIVAGIQLRDVIWGEWLMALSGILSVAFGVLMVVFRGAGAPSVVWLIGGYAIVFGILLTILAFRLRSLLKSAQRAFERGFSAI
jgi:uncharacterized membrane protein HdeD (DUF308 family)